MEIQVDFRGQFRGLPFDAPVPRRDLLGVRRGELQAVGPD
jgi:hypothetical protein